MEMKKGQVFVAFAVVFAGLLIGVAYTTGPQFTGKTDPSTKEYFSQSQEETQEAFNSGLEDNLSMERAKASVYSFDRFLERRSLEKGITFQAYHVLVLPRKGDALFINYFDDDLSIDLKAGTWTNTTVGVNESIEKTFSTDNVTVTLKVEETNTSHEFNAVTPKILTHSRMESRGEKWTGTLLG